VGVLKKDIPNKLALIGFLPDPRLVPSGRWAQASLLTLVRLEKHHRFSAICLTAGTPLLNRASRVFTSFAAFSM
jgi:hypothetical protein